MLSCIQMFHLLYRIIIAYVSVLNNLSQHCLNYLYMSKLVLETNFHMQNHKTHQQINLSSCKNSLDMLLNGTFAAV